MIFYILTVLTGVFLDFNKKLNNSETLRKIYIVWLYIFLCFGYTTGSDWRGYEVEFDFIHGFSDLRWDSEIGFNMLFVFCKSLFRDYWLTVGILKGLYLYTLIRVVKKLTPNWLSVIALLITGSLKFMLIDNPLRFMTAVILVNFAMELCIEKKYIFAGLMAFLSLFFHNASIFFIVLIPLFIYSKRIVRINKVVLIVIYIVVTLISSSVSSVEVVRRFMVALARYYSADIRSFSSYEVVGNNAFFTIGNLLKAVFFLIVIYTRDFITKKYENGDFIYGMTVCYSLLSELFLIIPTGFRLSIPLGVFYTVYYVYLLNSKHTLRWVFILYVCLSFPKDLWTTYKFIPYTNSIPYIITGHLDYSERYWYNISAYQDRTGKPINTAF